MARFFTVVLMLVSGAFDALAQAQATYPGGATENDNSCYGHCGETVPARACSCDEACHGRGTCCADRDEFCTPVVAKPTCSLTTDTNMSLFCGTDLGFVYQHGSNIEVLFGDTWDRPDIASACRDRGEDNLTTDDSQGFLPVDRPSTAMHVPRSAASAITNPQYPCGPFLTLDKKPASGGAYTFEPITLRDTDNTLLPMPPGFTPLAGFSDGIDAWGLFRQGGIFDTHLYLAKRAGARTNYRVFHDLGTTSNYVNPSVARVTSGSSSTAWSYETPVGTGGVALMFGRPLFWSADPRSNGLYLLYQTLPLTSWAPQHFDRLDAGGNPVWTSVLSDASPVLQDDFKASNQIDIKWVPEIRKWLMLYGGDLVWEDDVPPNDQPRHGAIHMRMANDPWGPWTRATPLLWRENMSGYLKCDATTTSTPAGCDDYAYGEGTAYTPGTWQPEMSSENPSCTIGMPAPVQPNGYGVDLVNDYCWTTFPTVPNPQQRGVMYAAELLPTWTHDRGINAANRTREVTIYFLVSTWMPYQVVLAAADLTIGMTDFDSAPLVQLRDYQNKAVARGSQTLTNRVGGVHGGKTAWRVALANGAPDRAGPARPIQIGDTVTFRSASDSGLTYLSRSGDLVRFDDVVQGEAIPDRAQWKLASTDTTLYPNGTRIVFGKTPFILSEVGSSSVRRLKSQSVGLRNVDGGGSDSIWRMTWACTAGDVCNP